MAGKRILVVEDNPMNMDLVSDLLEASGYQVDRATTGHEALELLKEKPFDLILMDIQLPGLDGLTATRMIKENPATKDTIVIAITAHAMQGDQEKVLRAGCDGYIPKPIDTKEFVGAVARFLNQSRVKS